MTSILTEEMSVPDAKDLLELYKLNLRDIDREIKWLNAKKDEQWKLERRGFSNARIENQVEKIEIAIESKRVSRRMVERMLKQGQEELRARLKKKG